MKGRDAAAAVPKAERKAVARERELLKRLGELRRRLAHLKRVGAVKEVRS
jgi:hypothetical protein